MTHPRPLQRGFPQRDAFGKGYFGVSYFYKLLRPKGSGNLTTKLLSHL